jgi:hypothetical protein
MGRLTSAEGLIRFIGGLMSRRPVLVALAAPALACSGFGAGPVTVGPAEKAVVLTAADIVPYYPGTLVVDPKRETWDFQRDFDGSYELEYRYESPDGDANVLMVDTIAYYEVSASDAAWVYTGGGVGMSLVDGSDGVTFVETPGLLTWGDEHQCKTMTVDGTSGGTMCRARKGQHVYVVVVGGLAFTEPGSMDALLAGPLAAIEAWTPTATPHRGAHDR